MLRAALVGRRHGRGRRRAPDYCRGSRRPRRVVSCRHRHHRRRRHVPDHGYSLRPSRAAPPESRRRPRLFPRRLHRADQLQRLRRRLSEVGTHLRHRLGRPHAAGQRPHRCRRGQERRRCRRLRRAAQTQSGRTDAAGSRRHHLLLSGVSQRGRRAPVQPRRPPRPPHHRRRGQRVHSATSRRSPHTPAQRALSLEQGCRLALAACGAAGSEHRLPRHRPRRRKRCHAPALRCRGQRQCHPRQLHSLHCRQLPRHQRRT